MDSSPALQLPPSTAFASVVEHVSSITAALLSGVRREAALRADAVAACEAASAALHSRAVDAERVVSELRQRVQELEHAQAQQRHSGGGGGEDSGAGHGSGNGSGNANGRSPASDMRALAAAVAAAEARGRAQGEEDLEVVREAGEAAVAELRRQIAALSLQVTALSGAVRDKDSELVKARAAAADADARVAAALAAARQSGGSDALRTAATSATGRRASGGTAAETGAGAGTGTSAAMPSPLSDGAATPTSLQYNATPAGKGVVTTAALWGLPLSLALCLAILLFKLAVVYLMPSPPR